MNKVCELLAESLEVDLKEVGLDLVFREHERWDSLAALSLITAIEDDFGLVLGDVDLQKLVTVQDLADLISKRSAKS